MVGSSIKQVLIKRRGGPEVLEIATGPCPTPGPGQVLVHVLAAGVSFADVQMREGVHPIRPRLPFVPGWDVVGDVAAVGEGVRDVQVGDRVAALPIIGGYSQAILLPVRALARVPATLDPAEVVCLVMDYIVAYQMLHRVARVRPGQSVLAHGAAGGVGSAVLKLGRVAGLQMFGTASAAKLSQVEESGATGIDYRREDFVARLRQLKPAGVDAVFDGIGGMHLLRSLRVLRPGGHLVAYGLVSLLAGGRGRADRVVAGITGYLLAFALQGLRGCHAHLYSIQRYQRRYPERYRADLATLCAMLADRQIQPLIAQRLALEEAARAHEQLGVGGVIGKLVLLPNG